MNKELRHGSNNLHVQKAPIAGDRTGDVQHMANT